MGPKLTLPLRATLPNRLGLSPPNATVSEALHASHRLIRYRLQSQPPCWVSESALVVAVMTVRQMHETLDETVSTPIRPRCPQTMGWSKNDSTKYQVG